MLSVAAKRVTKYFLKSEQGATAVEYAMIASLIFIAIVAGVIMLGQNLTVVYNKIAMIFS